MGSCTSTNNKVNFITYHFKYMYNRFTCNHGRLSRKERKIIYILEQYRISSYIIEALNILGYKYDVSVRIYCTDTDLEFWIILNEGNPVIKYNLTKELEKIEVTSCYLSVKNKNAVIESWKLC